MAKKTINLGVTPDGEGGDDIRSAFTKTNENFSELYRDIGNLSQLTTTAKNNLVDAINEAATSGGSGGSGGVAIDDDAGLGDTDVTWSADKSSREIGELSALIGDVESVLVAINGEP